MCARFYILRSDRTGRLIRMDAAGRPDLVEDNPTPFCEHAIAGIARQARRSWGQRFTALEVELHEAQKSAQGTALTYRIKPHPANTLH